MKTEQISNSGARARSALRPGNGDGNGTGREEALDKRHLLAALKQFRRGNFSVRLVDHLTGIDGRIADVFNEVVELSERMAEELSRMRELVGVKGQIGQRASLGDVTGAWATSVVSVNALINDLALPTS
jgi:hypothetical protein